MRAAIERAKEKAWLVDDAKKLLSSALTETSWDSFQKLYIYIFQWNFSENTWYSLLKLQLFELEIRVVYFFHKFFN